MLFFFCDKNSNYLKMALYFEMKFKEIHFYMYIVNKLLLYDKMFNYYLTLNIKKMIYDKITKKENIADI